MPFTLEEIPEIGITVKLRQLSAARNHVPFVGTALFTLWLNDMPIVRDFRVSLHGKHGWDSFRISKDHLRPGEYELTIGVSAESTTSYWVYEAVVELQ